MVINIIMFKDGFLLGFSLSGFQSEMGMGENDENSDWWKWVHDSNNIRTGIVSGDLPENGVAYWKLYETYNKFAKEIGANTMRLGTEWSRIFPKSTENVTVDVEMIKDDLINIDITDRAIENMEKISNQEAVKHYRKIFENIKDLGMNLIINAYHWPIPLNLHDPIDARDNGLKNGKNGWLNHKTVIEFVKYAAFIAREFGDIADYFSIMNEPNVVFGNGYFNVKSGFPPAFPSIEAGLLSKKHIIEAIGRSYDSMKKFTDRPIGLIYSNADYVPYSEEDQDAVEKALNNDRYSFFDSLIKGDMGWAKEIENSSSFSEKCETKRKDLENKVDWIGVNYYTRHVIKKTAEGGYRILEGYGHNAPKSSKSKDNREVSDYGWEYYPEGIYHVLQQYDNRYHLPMIVTENGIADSEDKIRPRYLVSHLYEVEKAVANGIDVRGYLHWSLLDNYEWSSGFGLKFGIIGVDLETKKIEIRPSALIFKKIAENNGIPEDLIWMAKR